MSLTTVTWLGLKARWGDGWTNSAPNTEPGNSPMIAGEGWKTSALSGAPPGVDV